MDNTIIQRGASFEFFPLLPPELRLDIWEYCLPSHIIEVHDAYYRAPFPGMPLETRRNVIGPMMPGLPVKPPLISQVCQESRFFALRHGGLQPVGLKHARMWFDKRTDSISVNPRHAAIFLLYGRNDVRDEDISPILQRFVSDSTIPLCIGSRLIEYAVECDYYTSLGISLPLCRQKGEKGVAEWAVECISQRTECTVILDKIMLHLKHQDACECGLFGLFGESSPAHIDIQDLVQRKKLEAAYKMRQTRKKRPGTWNIRALKKILKAEKINQRISRFLSCIEKLWLENKQQRLLDFSTENVVPGQNDRSADSLSSQKLPQFVFVIESEDSSYNSHNALLDFLCLRRPNELYYTYEFSILL
ncbi:hypothetical protein F4803DRAFT_546447 [Xylaria telfairii]|nr:hypothetical protein F4803DRAFT_546447 [Xylaria telfairii]